MSLNSKALRTRILAGAAAVTLSLSVAACSEAEDAASTAGDAAGSATAAAGSALNDTTAGNDADGADGSADDTAEGEPTDGAGTDGTDANGDAATDGATTEVETADGSTLTIPAAVADAAKAAGFSTLEDVEEGDNGEILANFVEGHIANAADSGAQPLVGKIAETWIDEGGLNADIGLPTAPEEQTADGWTQTFTNGVINWVSDGSGDFSADVQQN